MKNQIALAALLFALPCSARETEFCHVQLRPIPVMDVTAAPMGVVGMVVDPVSNQIREIYPGSDLLRFGVKPGDVIVASNHRRINGNELVRENTGTCGTFVTLDILQQSGELIRIPVMRQHPEMFKQYVQISQNRLFITNPNYYSQVK